MSHVRKRMNLPMKLIAALILISLFAVVSFAATVAVTTYTYQSYSGVFFNVVGGFTAASNGFAVVQSSGSASAQPATWSSGGTVQTALVAGHWYYSLTLTIAASGASPSTTYTVTVTWNTGSGYSTLGSTLTFTTLATITPGQTMSFFIDTGVTSFNAPVGITITVG
jgi:hypothetical protein